MGEGGGFERALSMVVIGACDRVFCQSKHTFATGTSSRNQETLVPIRRRNPGEPLNKA